jgi:phospholipid/cholesterol/gamma-HCH transport system substrate-binding protein
LKFKIRFADQIVGIFIIAALAALLFVFVLLGRSQRWFAKDAVFSTILPTAAGLSKNMPVQYKGFTIGNVSSFELNANDDVEVRLVIHEEYRNRVRQGSMVEIMVNPIGLGNQFLFHSGKGEILASGSPLPTVGSAQARELIRQGLAVEPPHDDTISVLLAQVNSIMENVGQIIAEVNEALGPGSGSTEIGKIVGSLQNTMAGLGELPQSADSVIRMVEGLLDGLRPAIANITDLTAELNDPDGLIYTVLDTDKDVDASLVNSLNSVSAILDNLDKTTAFIPTQIPQLSAIIMELRLTLKSAEDVLVALSNNPLLRKGVPQRPETQSGTGPRDLSF